MGQCAVPVQSLVNGNSQCSTRPLSPTFGRPQGGAPVAAFLIGCLAGDLAPAEKALTYPGEAWASLCERLAEDYTDWGGRDTGNPSIQRLVAVATGQATAAEPKEKKPRKKGGK